MKKILKSMLNEKEVLVGMIQQLVYPEVTEYLAKSNLDFLILDLEHTGHTIEAANSCLLAAAAHNIPMLVRVWEKEQCLIEQVLDAGAQGVVIPTVETREECEMIVKASKYAPIGERGWCNVQPARRWMNPWEDDCWEDDFSSERFCKEANRSTFIAPLIETPKGFDNLPQMLEVEGIDCFMLGAGDLSIRLEKDLWDDDVINIILTAIRQIRDAGKQSCPLATSGNINVLRKNGAKMVMLGLSERTVLQAGIRNEVRNIKGKLN